MAFNELQAALAIADLQRENRELRKQLKEALQALQKVTDENQRLRQRLEELEREAARQAAPFRRTTRGISP